MGEGTQSRAARTTGARRLIVAAALALPLVVDPWGRDTAGVKLQALTLLGLAALLLKGVEICLGRPSSTRVRAPDLCLLGLAAWATLSAGWAPNADLALTRALTLLAMFGLAWGVRDAVAGVDGARRWVLAMIGVAAVAMGIDALFIVQRSAELLPSEVKYASVLFVHNNMAASFAVVIAPLIVAQALGAAHRAATLAWAALLAGLLLYLDLLGSRAGLLGAAAGVVVVALAFLARPRLISWRPGEGRTPWLLGVAVVVAALLPLSEAVRGWIKERFYELLGATGWGLQDAGFRTMIWRKTMQIVGEAPLRGAGAGNFPVEYARFERALVAKPHAHNDALQVLAELGLPGLLLLLGLLAAAGWILLRVLAARAPGSGFRLSAGLLGSLVVFILGGLFEVPFALGATAAHLALLLGLAEVLDGPDRVAVGRRSLRWPLGAALVLATAPPLWITLQRLPASAWMAGAEAAAARGDLPAAEAALRRVAALGTGSTVPWTRLAELALQRGDGAAALQAARAARALWPHGPELPELEGDALMAEERYDDAVAAYRASVDQAPNRTVPLFKLAEALAAAGRHREGVDLLGYQLASDRLADVELIWKLAWAWRGLGETLPEGSDEWITATAAARHFFAVYIQDGDPARDPEAHEAFKHTTHLLQARSVPGDVAGSLQRWWHLYFDVWLKAGGWDMPSTALWTSMDADGEKLFPGWIDPEGPPPPRAMRH